MNFELGRHIVWNVELKKKKKHNLQKYCKLSQKSDLQTKSPSTQRTDSSLMAMKMDGYAEGRARQDQALAHREWTPIRWL